jgi:hypothetical protein
MILFGNLFGYFSKNWAIFFKSSGHPATEKQIEEEKNGGCQWKKFFFTQ